MIKQIKIDNNNVVELCSIGGIIEGGIDVKNIPDEVMLCPSKWIYNNGKYAPNTDYSEVTVDEVKASKIAESKNKLAEWLENSPMTYRDGKQYSVTAEKQSLLNGNLSSYERAQGAAPNVKYPLKWNATGEECTEWDYEDLVSLSLAIAAYVAPKVAEQQAIEIAIKACQTIEELNEVAISYE